MQTDLRTIGNQLEDREKGMQAMLYSYDQLNRIKKARNLTNFDPATGFASRNGLSQPQPYDVSYTYDPNGNLQTLQRYDENSELWHDFNYEFSLSS